MLYFLVLSIFVIVSVMLILVILAQSSKGGALDGMIGGTASNILGGKGASDFLKKWTIYLSVAFAILAFSLALIVSKFDTTSASSSKALQKLKSEVVKKDVDAENGNQNVSTESEAVKDSL